MAFFSRSQILSLLVFIVSTGIVHNLEVDAVKLTLRMNPGEVELEARLGRIETRLAELEAQRLKIQGEIESNDNWMKTMPTLMKMLSTQQKNMSEDEIVRQYDQLIEMNEKSKKFLREVKVPQWVSEIEEYQRRGVELDTQLRKVNKSIENGYSILATLTQGH
jgi:hypothetical protein